MWRPSLERVQNVLGELDEGLEDLTELAEEMIPILQEDMEERFYTETDPSGRPWKEWAPSYRPMAEAYPNVGILRRSEDMFSAAMSDDAWIAGDGIVEFDPSVLPDYWEVHEEGTDKVPVRSFIGVGKLGRLELNAWGRASEWLDEQLAKAEDSLQIGEHFYEPIGGQMLYGVSQVTGEPSRGMLVGGVFRRQRRVKGRFAKL